jgi:polysaccharide biosynthesis protein PslH
MNILFLSHCVPNPPDKGEKIRAFHELTHLAGTHRVHLACLARNPAELSHAEALRDRCASVDVALLRPSRALATAALRFAAGACLTTSFYGSRELRHRVAALARSTHLDAALVYSAAMAPYAPPGVPMLLDLVDVDSEKWLQYARVRRPGFLYGIEGRRLRRLERVFTGEAACGLLTTRHEMEILRRFAPAARVRCMENGVDFEYFDPACTPAGPTLEGRRFLVFVGAMDYYPNADAVEWFAGRALPLLRRHVPDLEFFIVGRAPTPGVRELANLPGVHVTGAVPDVRPYLKASLAAVAPLRIARGVQNKVLEALAMGKRVMASRDVCDTLEPLPAGVIPCHSELDYLRALEAAAGESPEIRSAARERFCWDRNMQVLSEELCRLPGQNGIQQSAACGWAPASS